MKNEQIVGMITQLEAKIGQGYQCPYVDKLDQIPLLVKEVERSNVMIEKIHTKVFEDNGESLVSQARKNTDNISDLKIAVQSFKNGQTGKTIMGKDTGDIWKSTIRLATIIAYIVAAALGIKVTFF
jgi:hypothetical protein